MLFLIKNIGVCNQRRMTTFPDLISETIEEYKFLYHLRNWRKKIACVHEEYFTKVTVRRPIRVSPYYGLFYDNIQITLFLHPEEGRTYASIPNFLKGPRSEYVMTMMYHGSFTKYEQGLFRLPPKYYYFSSGHNNLTGYKALVFKFNFFV